MGGFFICCPFVNLEDSINDDGMLETGGDKLPTFKKKIRGQGGSEACCGPNLKTGT